MHAAPGASVPNLTQFNMPSRLQGISPGLDAKSLEDEGVLRAIVERVTSTTDLGVYSEIC